MSTAAAGTCAYHPDRPSAGTCANCNQPICFGCETKVADQTVCQRCVGAIKARIASQMQPPSSQPVIPTPAYGSPQPTSGAPPSVTPVLAPPPGTYPPAGSYQPGQPGSALYPPYAQQPVYDPAADMMHVGHVFGAIGLSFLAGVFGLAAWFAFVYFTNLNIAIFAIGLGWLIGIAAVKGAGGRGGNVVAMISAIVAFIVCGLGVLPSFLEGKAWGYLFGLICLFYGVRRAYVTPLNAPKSW